MKSSVAISSRKTAMRDRRRAPGWSGLMVERRGELTVRRLGVLVLVLVAIVAAQPVSAAENTLKVKPRTVNFGPTPVGDTSMRSTTVTNTSSETINLTVAATKDWDDFGYGFLPGSTCPTFEPAALAPGESCVFVVRFWPSETFLRLRQDQIFVATATDPTTGAVLDADTFVFYGRAT